MIKLLSRDLKITGSSHEKSLLLNKVRLRTIDLAPELRIDGSFVYRAALYSMHKFPLWILVPLLECLYIQFLQGLSHMLQYSDIY